MKIKVKNTSTISSYESPMFRIEGKEDMKRLLKAATILKKKYGDFLLNDSGVPISVLIDRIQKMFYRKRSYCTLSKQTIINLGDKWKNIKRQK